MLLKSLALALIRGYQKFISPYKGFSCALRVYGGGHSCSRFGYDAINRHGFFVGMKLLHRRLAKCSWHAHQHKGACQSGHAHAQQVKPAVRPPVLSYAGNGRFTRQGGFVDADCGGCDGCDVPSCDVPSCDLPSCELPSCELPACELPACEGFGADRLAGCGCDLLDAAAWGCDPAPCNSRGCDCGPGPGHVREQRRLDEMRRRREEKKRNGEPVGDEDDNEAGTD